VGLVLLAAAAAAAYWLFLRPPAAAASATALEFAPARVGRDGEQATVEIANRGRRPLVVAGLRVAGAAGDDFAVAAEECVGRELGAGQSCAVTLVFRPSAPGRRAAGLEVTSNAPGPPLAVVLAGTGLAPALTAEPQALDFGRVAVGKASGAASLELHNRGSAPVTIARLAVEGSGERSFVWVANGCSGQTLEPQAGCAVRIAFQPRETGDFKAQLRVWSDAPEEPRVVLAGLGVAPGILLQPRALDFGTLRPGQQTEPRGIRVTNTGNAPLTIERVGLEGSGSGGFEIVGTDCAGRTLEGEAGCSVEVRYRPRDAALHRAVVRFRAPGLSRPAEVALEGAALEPRLELAETAIDFGQIVQFGTNERSLALRNAGSAELVLEAIEIEGGGGAFGISDRACPERLAPGAGCTLGLRFSPGRVGAAAGRLRIRHSAPGSPAAVALSGTAVALPAPAAAVEPAAVAFGALPVGERSDIFSVKVKSTGSARLDLGGYEIAGEDAADFAIVQASCEGLSSLQPGSDCTIGLRFRPQAAGRRSARLVIRHGAAGGRALVTLTGEGY